MIGLILVISQLSKMVNLRWSILDGQITLDEYHNWKVGLIFVISQLSKMFRLDEYYNYVGKGNLKGLILVI